MQNDVYFPARDIMTSTVQSVHLILNFTVKLVKGGETEQNLWQITWKMPFVSRILCTRGDLGAVAVGLRCRQWTMSLRCLPTVP